MSTLFQRVVLETGISSLFAEHAIVRACERAGVEPKTLSPATLKIALPEIERTVDTFCHEERAEILTRLQLLTRA